MSDLTTMKRTEYVTAFFDSEADAEAAVARIEAEGIPRDEIRVVPGAPDAGADRTAAEPRQKGFFEALGDMFMPAEDRYAYAEGLSRGGFLVSLYTTVDNRDRIFDILDDAGTIDMDAREESWRAEGWAGLSGRRATDAGRGDAQHRRQRHLAPKPTWRCRTRTRSMSSRSSCGSASETPNRVGCASAPTSSRPRWRKRSICATRRFGSSVARRPGGLRGRRFGLRGPHDRSHRDP